MHDELLQQDEVDTSTPDVIGFNKSWFIEILGKILNKLKMLVRFILFYRVIYVINQCETNFVILSIHGKSVNYSKLTTKNIFSKTDFHQWTVIEKSVLV